MLVLLYFILTMVSEITMYLDSRSMKSAVVVGRGGPRAGGVGEAEDSVDELSWAREAGLDTNGTATHGTCEVEGMESWWNACFS